MRTAEGMLSCRHLGRGHKTRRLVVNVAWLVLPIRLTLEEVKEPERGMLRNQWAGGHAWIM